MQPPDRRPSPDHRPPPESLGSASANANLQGSQPRDAASSNHGATKGRATPRLPDGFEFVAALGAGASGSVYHARTTSRWSNVATGEDVALKVLHADAADGDTLDKMFAEARLGMRIRSPFVCQILGADRQPATQDGPEIGFLVMELIRGDSLREHLKGVPLVEDLCRRIGEDAARGLSALHRVGVVHRDIKPENLALTAEGRVVVVDLGMAGRFKGRRRGLLARSAELLTGNDPAIRGQSPRASGGLVGSLAFAAPEALRGRRLGPGADLYSLGVTLFEAATGEHPFQEAMNAGADELIAAVLRDEPRRPSHLRPRISPFLERLLFDLLQKDPERRPRDAREIAERLEYGEQSTWWRRFEDSAPELTSRRRLRALRRPAPTPFVNREDAINLLNADFERAGSGEPTARWVQGPRNIGRRRLLDEVVMRWLDTDPTLLHFYGGEASADPLRGRGAPFTRFLVDMLLHGDGPDSPKAAGRLAWQAVKEWGFDEEDGKRLSDVVLERSDSPVNVRAALLARAIEAMSKQRTLVLRIDHAERLDSTARRVISLLTAVPETSTPRRSAHPARKTRRLILLASTLGSLPGELASLELPRIELTGLGLDAFLGFGLQLFAPDVDRSAMEPPLRAAWRTLAGSPGNLIEALDSLTGETAGAPAVVVGRPGSFGPLPAGTQIRPAPNQVARLREFLAKGDGTTRYVLCAAAVLGRQGPVDDLTQLTGLPELRVLESLGVVQSRVVRVVSGEFRFRHADYRVELLRSIPSGTRRRLHRQAAWVLEDRKAPPLAVGLQLS